MSYNNHINQSSSAAPLHPVTPQVVSQPLVVRQVEFASENALQASEMLRAASQSVTPGFKPDVDRLQREADELLRANCPADALLKYEMILASFPRDAVALRGMGVSYLILERYQGAEEYFRRAVIEDSNDVAARVGLATSLCHQGHEELGFNQFVDIARELPTSLTVLPHLVRVGYKLNRMGALEEALKCLVQANQANANLLYCLAGCIYKQERLGDAKQVINQILQLQPNHAGALELNDACIKGQSQRGTASSGETPTNYSIELLLNSLEEAKHKGDFQAVITGATRIIDGVGQSSVASSAQKAHAALLRAEAIGCSGDTQRALAEFKQYLNDTRFGHRAWAGQGAVLAAQQRWDEAVGSFQTAIDLDSRNDAALAGLGICAVVKGDQERAWSYFQQSLKINPENHRALTGVVELGYALKRLPELEMVLTKYLDLHPVDLSMIYAYAGCCYAQGRIDEAKEQLERIKIFEPNHVLANELLMTIAMKGNSAISLSPSNPPLNV